MMMMLAAAMRAVDPANAGAVADSIAAAPADTVAAGALPDSLTTPPPGALPGDASTFARPGPAHRLRTGAVRPDRLSHTSLALVIGIGAGLASGRPASGAAAAVTLATAKELLDDRFDRGDLAAGIAGAGFAWLLVAALTR